VEVKKHAFSSTFHTFINGQQIGEYKHDGFSAHRYDIVLNAYQDMVWKFDTMPGALGVHVTKLRLMDGAGQELCYIHFDTWTTHAKLEITIDPAAKFAENIILAAAYMLAHQMGK